MRDEWKFWIEFLSPKKFKEEKPVGVSDSEWKVMKKRFSYRRLKEVSQAYDQLSRIVLTLFGKEVEKLGVRYVPSEGDMKVCYSVVKAVRSLSDDPDEQFSFLVNSIRTYISLYPSYGHKEPTIYGYLSTLRRNPAVATITPSDGGESK